MEPGAKGARLLPPPLQASLSSCWCSCLASFSPQFSEAPLTPSAGSSPAWSLTSMVRTARRDVLYSCQEQEVAPISGTLRAAPSRRCRGPVRRGRAIAAVTNAVRATHGDAACGALETCTWTGASKATTLTSMETERASASRNAMSTGPRRDPSQQWWRSLRPWLYSC